MELEGDSTIFIELIFPQMLALHFDMPLQGVNLSFRDAFGGEPRRHSLQCLACNVDLDCFARIVLDQIHTMTSDDFDDALSFETVDSSPKWGSAHPQFSAELFDADLVTGAIAIPVNEECT